MALPKNGARHVPAIDAMSVAPVSWARLTCRSSVIGLMKTAKAKFETTPVFIINAIVAPKTIHHRFRNMPVCSMAFFPDVAFFFGALWRSICLKNELVERGRQAVRYDPRPSYWEDNWQVS